MGEVVCTDCGLTHEGVNRERRPAGSHVNGQLTAMQKAVLSGRTLDPTKR